MDAASGIGHWTPGQVLSEGQVEQLNDGAGAILEETGFKVMDEDALRLCAARGARVEEASGTVRLPRELLRELLAETPSQYTVSGIDGRTYDVGGGAQWGVAIVTDPWIIDYDTQQPRRPGLDDLRRHTAVAQQMNHVAGMSWMDFPVTDVSGPSSNLRAWEAHLLNTAKHYHFIPAEPERNRQWEDIVRIFARGDDPVGMRLFSVHVAVKSPLTITGDNVDLLRLACRYDAPVLPTICPMAGTTAPYGLAATLLLGHAENLFVAALTQLLRPGNPFLYMLGPSVMDMRSGHDLYYTLDKALWKAGAVQLARSRGLPVAAECGGAMSYRYDMQTGMEGALFMLAAVQSGADVLSGFGSGYNAVGMSAELMLVQEAWMESARFLGRGIRTDDVSLAIDSIRNAAPGGDFLTDPLTLAGMHGDAFFANDLFDLTPAGEQGKSLLDRAHEKVERAVADFTSPVPDDVQEALRRYFHDECARVES